MRQLLPEKREAIMREVRRYMGNATSCPFYFEHDFARVVSGEEEGIYGWTAINFLLGKLLPASAGTGTVDANSSVGALDLGGASTQISFFVPDQDILANMFKLQIGAQKHWNIYTHSFLYFGVNSARDRLHMNLAAAADGHKGHIFAWDGGREGAGGKKKGGKGGGNGGPAPEVANPCLPAGYEEEFHVPNRTGSVLVRGVKASFGDCLQTVIPLLRKVNYEAEGRRERRR